MSDLVVAADVGGLDWYHAGDEAMLAANLAGLRRLRADVTFTVLSRDPAWTAAHYGVCAIPGLGFGSSPDQRARLERDVLDHVEDFRETGSLDASRAGAEAIDALAGADALVVSGGGNLCSRWPEHIVDRATLMRIAHVLAKPVVVLGQTIGPALEDDDRERLARVLPFASLVGVRGLESAELVRSLGADPLTILEQLDDAWFLDAAPSAAAVREAARLTRPWIAVTLAPLAQEPRASLPTLEALGKELSAIARATDADLAFLPHWNALAGTESDALLARRLFGFLDEPARAQLLPVLTGEDLAWLTRRASLVVSTRYHPIVFGLSGGVPCVAIASDEHTRVRHVECLRHAGLERFAVSFDAALAGELASLGAKAWQERDAIREHLYSRTAAWRTCEARKWSRVARALGWPDIPLAPSVPAAAPSLDAEPDPPAPLVRPRPSVRTAPTVSAVVLTRNGSGRLERALESIVAADLVSELVVFVDRTSTDDSASIARRFTATVLPMDSPGYIEAALQRMAAACSGEFVLRLDDDETLGGEWDAPFDAGGTAKFTHFLVPRRWLVPGQDAFISSGAWFPDLQLRLFRNDPALVRWPSDLHDPIVVEGAGTVLWDRWIDHHVLWQQTRAERVRKCAAYERLRPSKHLSHFYLWEEQSVRLCPYDASGLAGAEPLESGVDVSFDANGTAATYTLEGWSHAEPWGTWTEGPKAVLRLPLKRPPAGPIDIVIEANAFVRPAHPSLHVTVSCGDTVVATWSIDSADVARYAATIPAPLAARTAALAVSLHFAHPRSPADLGESSDSRRLALGVRRLRLAYR